MADPQPPTAADIFAEVSQQVFGQRIIQNNFRASVVETIVNLALRQTGWTWCSADWGGWDFVHKDGTKLEVKQSAVAQTWLAPDKPTWGFDIAKRTGYFKGSDWIPADGGEPMRFAQIYVFAFHPILERDGADHRDPGQWQFYVVDERNLPDQRSLSLSKVRGLSKAFGWGELACSVEELRTGLREAGAAVAPEGC